MRLIIILYLLLTGSHGFSQSKASIAYDDKMYEIMSKEHSKVLFFQAEKPFLQLSTTGLNDLQLKEGSDNGVLIRYYEKNYSSQNVDFLYENLIPGQTYYIILQPNFFEKNIASVSLIAMDNRLNIHRTAQTKRPYQNAKVVEVNKSKMRK